ncbi:MAG: phosphoglucosamine mutase [Pelotomaculum sp.]|jgi:phosphoglucosamine mutase
MAALFGTDGVRGVANRELTAELAFKLGRAGAWILAGENTGSRIVIGKDTRISGDMLEAALIAGICSAGVDVLRVGVMTTPGIAYLTRNLQAVAGVVISASHNPVEDNGIKFFGPSGYKLPDETEAAIEALVLEDCCSVTSPVGGGVGRVYQVDDAVQRYVAYACGTISTDLAGIKLVVDCANGAASQIAPLIYKRLGAEVIPIFNHPDGVNINNGCGSTHPEELMEAVVDAGADLGLAHDGDSDRVLAVDASGRLVDGDQIMVACAGYLKAKGQLAKNTVVVTVMSNLGLHLAFQKLGIKAVETKVGDRYVLEELLRTGACFGGEQSGHIIFLDYNTTGDGIITALQLMAMMKETGQPLDQLAAQMERLPQLLVNVQVADKDAVMKSPVLKEAIQQEEKNMGGSGRILVRPSGTEPLVRVMAEGRDMLQLEGIVGRLTNIIKEL